MAVSLAKAGFISTGTPRFNLATLGIWLLLAVAVLLSAALIPAFRDPENLANIIRQSAVLGVLAIGQTFVIVAGLIDLSVGMAAGLVVVFTCSLIDGNASMTLPIVLLMLCSSTLLGGVIGSLIDRLKVHPLIFTFAMLTILQGVIFTYTDRSVGSVSEPLRVLANGSTLGIPNSGLLLALVLVLAHVLLTRTQFGYRLMASGGNPESARRAGINVRRIRVWAFALSGASAGLAGLLLAGRLGTGYPLAGANLELDAIVAVVLGGTALTGGRGCVIRTVGGVLALTVLSNVLNLMEVSSFVQMFLKGTIVIVAIIANQFSRKSV